MQDFLSKFKFQPPLQGAIGVEREFFLQSQESGLIVPEAVRFLNQINDEAWTDELSACQVEHRTRPHSEDMNLLKLELVRTVEQAQEKAASIGLRLKVLEVAPESLPLDVYPRERYIRISKKFSKSVLSAACRICGLHYHLGVRDMAQALEVYTRLSNEVDYLVQVGEKTNGLRMKLYNLVEPNWRPVALSSVNDLYELAQKRGFVENPRNWWQIIRISIHGTVEVRSFGMTGEIEEIIEYGRLVHSIAFP